MPNQPKKDTRMFKYIVTPALIALTLAGAANAASPSSDAQLAAAAGVEAGAYTAAELVAIIEARKENDVTKLNFYLSGANRAAAEVKGDSAGQLAKLAGVQPGAYSASELEMIVAARKENDRDRVAYVLSGTNRIAPAAAEVVTPGEAQLAASLGVDPAQYTLAELTKLAALKTASND
jgi:hypothetical protein